MTDRCCGSFFMMVKVSSNKASPVLESSTTWINLSESSNLLREGSSTMAILPRKANSKMMHPRRAYEMLSFQKDKYPSLSLIPIRMTSSMRVNVGSLFSAAERRPS
ncbi:hypothetical protein WICPIJ_004460 [Wickerhamomyces pijperi]|uniref:Uncharacterized protein n=1 Tax=Wickerhamomyces pijperi TaxID=599730 RepID=A0A9P8Q7M1_WICPI|nr:hypothetical protein WICPIJ_004460 [Wickerhamomyces pijperi]